MSSAIGATAAVAVPSPLRRPFHYRVPERLDDRARIGARVLVPFGAQRLVGYIIERDTPPPEGVALVSILSVLDDLPTFTPQLVGLLSWMAGYYHAPIGEIFRIAHPAGVNAKGKRAVRLTDAGRSATAEGATGAVLELLRTGPNPVAVAKLPETATEYQLTKLVKRGWLERLQIMERPRVEVKRVKIYQAVMPAPSAPRGPGGKPLARDRLHASMVGRGQLTAAALKTLHPRPGPHLKRLVEEGVVSVVEVESVRDAFFGEPVSRDVPPTLSAQQQVATTALIGALGGYAGFLLKGVTGSGKTEVYLHVIAAALARGLGCLVLVPEIALTPQLARRFRARFGDGLAILHSGLSAGARFDQWRRLRRGEAKLVIGARSAVFAPVQNLGVIVVDEAHDGSYKQGDTPRYHARDMALLRAHREGALVVLGTATPSLESLHNVSLGKLRILSMTERPTGGTLPEVHLVDLRRHPPLDEIAPFLSAPLRQAMASTLARGEQTILFLNRRGYASLIRCRSCGHVVECANCAISMTWHQQRRMLRCHYCDAARPCPPKCPDCARPTLDRVGQGTERVEEAIQTLFPKARIARMDRDTAQGARLQALLNKMRHGEIDILVGTQMVTKGHDFPNVTLVGVLSADASLDFPDFRASERTFQLLAQVAGRAGRGRRKGQVLIQTWQPEHECMAAAKTHDDVAFATWALQERRALQYPPFSFAAAIRVDGPNAGQTEAEARRVARAIRQAMSGRAGIQLRGPTAAAIPFIRRRHRWAMLLIAKERGALHEALAAVETRAGKGLRVQIDVDPRDFL